MRGLLPITIILFVALPAFADEDAVVQAEVDRIVRKDARLAEHVFFFAVGGQWGLMENEAYNDVLRPSFGSILYPGDFAEIKWAGGLDASLGAVIGRHSGEVRYTYVIPYVSENQDSANVSGGVVGPNTLQMRATGWSIAAFYRYYLYGSPVMKPRSSFAVSAGGGVGLYKVALQPPDGLTFSIPGDTTGTEYPWTMPMEGSNVGFSGVITGEFWPTSKIAIAIEAEYLAAKFRKLTTERDIPNYNADEYIFQYNDGSNIEYDISGPRARLSLRYYAF